MDKKEAIQFLKEKLGEIPYLAKLNHDNQEFPLWHEVIKGILGEVFGQKSSEYEVFSKSALKYGFVRDSQTEYLDALKRRETAILSIIQKNEILGFETEPDKVTEHPKEQVKEASSLFDTMQFHPKVVEASESLFKTGNYASAILEAFKAVNNFVKGKSGLSPNELRGIKDRPLMAKVFDEKEPLIKLNELITDTDINEQEGFKLLFMGATEGIRNPKAHDLIKMKDPYKTLEYLAFASLLLKKIDFWEAD